MTDLLTPTAAEELPEPYRRYQQLRANPYMTHPGNGNLVLSRYSDVSAALKAPQLSSREIIAPSMDMPKWLQPLLAPAMRLFSRVMLFTDPPDHTRLRGLATRAFTPRRVEEMRAQIERLADGLLDDAEGGSGPVDLVEAYANWLPIIVIADMMGTPIKNRRAFKRWSDNFALLLASSQQSRLAVAVRGVSSMYFLQRFLKHQIRQRRKNPGDTLLDAMIAAEEGGDVLTQDELIANSLLLLVAGHFTTTNLIASGILLLLQHPEQLELLKSRPELLSNAVEEFLRYECPLHFTGRVAAADVQIGERLVKAGETMAISLGAANWDPEQFPNAERLDITRTENRHVAFGAGIHYCLGAALARLEGQVAIATLLRRFPNLSLADPTPHWRPTGVIRGLERLPVYLR